MEEKDSKRIITHEEMENIKNKIEELVNSNDIDPDEVTSEPVASESKPQPTVAEVVEILNSIEYNVYDEAVTDWAEKFDETRYHIWMGLHVEPSKVEIICFQTETTYDGPVPYYKIVVEGIENVASLIIALHIDVEDTENLLVNLFDALADCIPFEWAEDYYDPAEILEELNKRIKIEYKKVKC